MTSTAAKQTDPEALSSRVIRQLRSGIGPLFAALIIICVVLSIATVWLFLTNPVTVATAVSEGQISPFVRDLAAVLLQALEGLLKYL